MISMDIPSLVDEKLDFTFPVTIFIAQRWTYTDVYIAVTLLSDLARQVMFGKAFYDHGLKYLGVGKVPEPL